MLEIWKQCNRKISIVSKIVTFGGLLFIFAQVLISNLYINHNIIMGLVYFSWAVASFSAYVRNKKKGNLITGVAFVVVCALFIFSSIR